MVIHVPAVFAALGTAGLAMVLPKNQGWHAQAGRASVRLFRIAALAATPWLLSVWLSPGIDDDNEWLSFSAVFVVYCGFAGWYALDRGRSVAASKRLPLYLLGGTALGWGLSWLVGGAEREAYYRMPALVLSFFGVLDLLWTRLGWWKTPQRRVGRHVFWMLTGVAGALHSVTPERLPFVHLVLSDADFEVLVRLIPPVGMLAWFLSTLRPNRKGRNPGVVPS